MRTWLSSLLALLSCVVEFGELARHDLGEMTFFDVPGAACFRRFNGTHQFGCGSALRGSQGVVQVLGDEVGVDRFLSDGVAGPYVVVVNPALFSRSTVDKLVASGKVNGLLVAWYANSSAPDSYSPDDSCPNRGYDANSCSDDGHPWNPFSNNFLLFDWPFPIFVVHNDDYLINITDCYRRFNEPVDESQLSRPLCVLQLKSHMFGAVNSEVCMRRSVNQLMTVYKFCDPLGNDNIVYPVVNLQDTASKKLIAVVARLDGVSLFDGIAPAAMSAVSGAAGLIVLSSVFNSLLPAADTQHFRGIVFVLLNGESFDFIGSQRIVYDMQRGAFISPTHPVTLDDVAMVVELSQLGPNGTFYLHRTAHREAAEFAESVVSYSASSTVSFKLASGAPGRLPPVSANTFVNAHPNISAVVVTNYDMSFVNRYYNGMFDNAANLRYRSADVGEGSTQHNLASAAVVLARALVGAVTRSNSSTVVNVTRQVAVMDEVLNCYFVTYQCPLLEKVYPLVLSNPSGFDVLSTYVGVANNVGHTTRATWKLFAYLAAPSQSSPTPENCTAVCSSTPSDELQCFWVREADGAGTCVKSPIRLLPAVSPAFEIEGYNWTSGEYSTWTESVWSVTSVKMFVRSETRKDVVVFVSGLLAALISLVTAYYVNKKADTIFAVKLHPEDC